MQVQCLWIGPNVSDFDCEHCVLGYERTSDTNATCVKPGFRAHRGWGGGKSDAQLQPHDARGNVVKNDAGADTFALLTKHTYTIPAPALEPKETQFVGYKQPCVTRSANRAAVPAASNLCSPYIPPIFFTMLATPRAHRQPAHARRCHHAVQPVELAGIPRSNMS